MLLSAVCVLVVAQSSSEIPEGLMNNPVFNVIPDGNCGSIVPLLCIMGVQRHFSISVSFDLLLTLLS